MHASSARESHARRRHQREQFVDRLLREVAHALGVLPGLAMATDITPFTTALISSRKSVRNEEVALLVGGRVRSVR